MTILSLNRKIKRGDAIRAVCGYCQGDVWIVRPRLNNPYGDKKGEWLAVNTETGEVVEGGALARCVNFLNKAHGVRIWATL